MGFENRVIRALQANHGQLALADIDLQFSDLDLGADSADAGTLDIFPATAARGKVTFDCTEQTGDTTVTMRTGAMGQASVITTPDPGASTANLLLSEGAQTIAGTITFSTAIETGTTGITGSALLLQSLNPLTIQLNDVDALQLDNAAISSFAAATDTAGNDCFIETEDAGGTATAARVAGLYNLKTGDGSASTGNFAGGAGGALTLVSGAGGANTGGGSGQAGGAGGAIAITCGGGGNTDDTGSDNGGIGGGITLTAAGGGNATAGSGDGGAGGNIDFVPGGASTTSGGAVGAAGEVLINGSAGLLHASVFYEDSGGDPVSVIFFVADRAYRVKAITGRPRVVGSDGGAVTATIEKCPSGTAIGSGTDLHSGTYNLKGTADTDQALTLSTTVANIEIANGDSINLVLTGTTAAAVGCVSVMLVPI